MADNDQEIELQAGHHPNHDARVPMLHSLTILGGLAIVGVIVIFCIVPAEHATTQAGLLLTLLTAIFAALMSVGNRQELQQVRIQTNSALDRLVKASEIIANAKGHREERDERDARDANW